MRAVVYAFASQAGEPALLLDAELPMPEPRPHDLLVAVRAISVNPVDTKVRRNTVLQPGMHKVLGWDAAGVVRSVGAAVTLFKPGDAVFYAGALDRAGSNAEFQVVDERLVGPKPKSLSFAEAAALPLTATTAWEALFDRLDVNGARVPGASHALLIIGGGGGVGSITIQLARQLTELTVIATASRPETRSWCLDLGAHHVLDHARPLAAQVAGLGIGAPGYVFPTTSTDAHFAQIAELIAPQGKLALIDDPNTADITVLKRKSVSLHWEYMFVRSLFQTPDIARHHELLSRVAQLVEAGTLRSTLTASLGCITASNLQRAHELIDSRRVRGKLVLEGFAQ